MFHNMPIRQRAFRSNEQYQKILDVASRYAIHFGDKGIHITCGQLSGRPDLNPRAPYSTLSNISHVYGNDLGRELLPLQSGVTSNDPEGFAFQCQGFLSNANYNRKQGVFIFFIAHRLVECDPIKRMLESIYSEILPKHTHPFVYMALEMPSHHLDVNVSPTKRKVQFLYQDEILEALHSAVRQCLLGANESRTFYTQSVLQGLPVGRRLTIAVLVVSCDEPLAYL